MDLLLLDLIGAIGFQCNDTWTTFIAVKVGAMEGNKIFKFLSKGRVRDFIVIGTVKALFPILVYLWSILVVPEGVILLYDFYLEAGVTAWNILTIYRHKTGRWENDGVR